MGLVARRFPLFVLSTHSFVVWVGAKIAGPVRESRVVQARLPLSMVLEYQL